MSDDLKRALDRQAKELAGLTPIEKQIILLKLVDLYEHQPKEFGKYGVAPVSPEREWISATGALVRKYNQLQYGIRFDTFVRALNRLGSIDSIVGIVGDVIAEIQLDLELDGRSEIGTVYKPGEVYKFYADLKEVIAEAERELFLIEPYLTGDAFDEYFGGVNHIELKLLVGRTAGDLKPYTDRHTKEFKTRIELRRSNDIHDRLIIADRADAWVIGGSLNQKGDKPTYLLPLTPGIAAKAVALYTEIWDRSTPVE